MAKGSLRVNGIIVDADGELKASTGDSIVIREDDGSAVITVDTSGNVLIGGPTTVGVDDSGHDVKFFGATSGKYMLWDESADSLIVDGNVGIGTTTTTDAGVTITTSVTRDGAWDAKLALQSTGATDYPALIFSGCSATDRFGAIVQTASTSGADSNQITAEINFQNTSTTAGDIVFKTNDNVGTGAPVERMRIDSAGQVTLSTAPAGFNYVATVAASGTGISVTGSGTAAAGVTVAHADTSNQTSSNNSGNSFIQDITLDTFGHITAITSATATDTNTTYSVATASALGLVKIGYTASGKNYAVALGSSGTDIDKMYVNVPWTDTTYSVASGTALGLVKTGYSGTGQNYAVALGTGTEADKMYVNVPWTDTTYSVASGTALGLVQIGYAENAKNYPVELGSGTNANKMFVNVPWTDNNTTYSVADSSTLGLIKIGYTQTGKNYPVQLSSEQAYVNVPWTDTDTNTTYSAGTGLSLSGTTFSVNSFSDIVFKEQSGTDTSAVRQQNIHIDAHSSGPGVRGPAGLYIEADTVTGSTQSGQTWSNYGGVEIASDQQNGYGATNPYLRIRGKGVYGVEFMGTGQWVDVNIFHETGSGVYNQNVTTTNNIYNAFTLARTSGSAAGLIRTACNIHVQRSDLDLGAAAGYMQSTHNNYFNRGYIKTLYYNAFSQTSDRNVKKNINPISLGLDFVKSLNPVQFNFKDEGEGDNPLSYGFIAQDIEEKINDGLSWKGWNKGNTPNPNENWKEDEEPEILEGTQTIDMVQFIAPLTKAVQELSAQVEALKTRVSELEGV